MTTPTKKTADALSALHKRKAAILERIRRAETKLALKNRKEATRLKVLIGVAFLNGLSKNPELDAIIRTTLDRTITNPKDRAFLANKGHLLKDHAKHTSQ